jgi:hypothetical protein
MGIRAKRLPEYGVTVVIWSGRLTLEELRRHFGALDAACTDRWINYWDPSVDLSGLDVARIPEVKRLLAGKLKELYGDKRAISAVVCDPALQDPFPGFWPSYASADHAYPAEVAAFPSLEAACAWLNLSDDGRRAVIDAVEGEGCPSAHPRESREPGSSAGAKL